MADSGGHETRQHRKPSDMACSEGARREKALTLKRSKSGYVGQLTKRYNEVRNIMERSCDNSAIDVVLKIKDKILATFEVYQECHAEHVEFLVDDKERDDAQKAYRVECDTRQKMEQMVNSWIAKIKGKYKELPQIEADDSISHVSSKASTTASKMKLRAKAKHTVALLKLKQLEEQQALQDKIDEVEITMKLDEAMKLKKIKRKQAFLDAQHEVQIRNAEYEVYESEFRNETLETLETLNKDETLEEESAVKELQTKMNIDSYVKKSSTNPELHHEVKSREKTELHESFKLHDTEEHDLLEPQGFNRIPQRYHGNPFHDNKPTHDAEEHDLLEPQGFNRITQRYHGNPFHDNKLTQELIFVTPQNKKYTPKESTRIVNKSMSLNNPFWSPVKEASFDATRNFNCPTPMTYAHMDTPSKPSAQEWLEMNSPVRKRNVVDPNTKSTCSPSQFQNESGVYDEIVKHQERIMSTMANALRLPKPELFTFDGNPLNYWRFIRNFERNIEEKSDDEGDKLNYLLQYCVGKAKEVVRNCVVMEPSLGYVTARKLLKERFGEPYVIANAHIEQITKGPPLKASDREGLLNLADKLKDCELTLQSIGYLEDLNSTDNLKQITERFPTHLKARWLDIARVIRNGGGKPNIGQMSQFITEKAMAANDPVFGDIMDNKDSTKNEKPRQKFRPAARVTSKANTYTAQAEKPKLPENLNVNTTNSKPSPTQAIKCWLCEGAHMLSSCHQFEKKNQEERLKITRSKGLCDNCFKRGHKAKECYQKGHCTYEGCTGKHHPLLHSTSNPTTDTDIVNRGSKNNVENNASKNNAQCNVVKSEVNNACKSTTSDKDRNKVCLPIVPVRVRGKNGRICVTTYALLDKGSNASLCEQRLLDQLDVDGEKQTFLLSTVDCVNTKKRGHIASLEVLPLESEEVIDIPSVRSVDKLCISTEGAPTQEDIKNWSHLKGITVPAVDSKDVTLLIGNDIPEVFWGLEERRGQRKEPYAVKSLLGWTIIGPIGKTTNCHSMNTFNVTLCDDNLLTQVEKFWKADFGDPILSVKEAMSIEDKKALSIMEESVTLVDNHYQVALPWKHGEPCMLNNRQLAESRLSSLKRKLQRNPDIHQKYKAVIDDHLDKGYARQLPEDSYNPTDQPVWYLPHHAVINLRKPEKLRVVYDCATKWKDISLNDQLLQGPDMTNSLVGVLTRFRENPIAIAADIEAMFLQVQVHPKDRDMLRFLWYEDGDLDRQPSEFQMLSHIFGATSSPSVAGFALRRTADDNCEEFNDDIVNSVYRNFYVDDFLKSTRTVDDAKQTAQSLSQLLKRGGFHLTKWISNDKTVLDSIPEAERAKSVKKLDFETLPTERTLGVHWNVETDHFGLQTDMVKQKPLTRRSILSVMSSVFDPLGIVAPFMLPVKVLLQKLCKQNIGWDDPVPEEAVLQWSKWLKDLPLLSKVSVPRCLEPPALGDVVTRELHHFGDASQSGYGAVSYLRSENLSGEVNVSFLMGKSRLAPVKTTTIPRLELSAAVLAVKLDGTIREELDLTVQSSWFWTDSTTVLRYILNENKRFSTFVANRVAAIHDASTSNQWLYVDSSNNPADDASRGLSANEITVESRWLKGPEFLRKKREEWPTLPCDLPAISDDDPEVKTKKQTNLVQAGNEDILTEMFKRFSSWERLRVAVAWLLRFKNFLVNAYRLRHGRADRCNTQNSGSVTVKELKEAELEIIKYVQRRSFPREIVSLKECKPKESRCKDNSGRKTVERTSPAYKLNPIILDEVLCVGGRLENAAIPERSKHPPILPKDHHVCELIVRHYYQLYGHAGKEHVLSLIRQYYWIIRARVLVKRMIGQCFDCRRRNAPTCQQFMADLPADRLIPDKPPFSYVGIDYFGPIQVKRARSVVKRYGCIFTCLTTRAVHIEIAHTLDTCSFIDALHRFINRRGKPLLIRSDNGTNFRGGERELRESIQQWNQQAIDKVLKQRNIEWIFNPPSASNMGGVWERLIRSIRQILRVLLKEQTVDDETLLTIMTHVEAILNSRPLTPCSDDCKDENPLTPNQILLLRDEVNLPPGVFTKSDSYGRRRWRQAQYLADQFWKRWLKEYIPQLQERSKWNHPRRNISVGDVVLVADQNVSRGSWPLARVLETHKAKDGYVRSVKIKTKSSILTRPVNKLCLLEGNLNDSSI